MDRLEFIQDIHRNAINAKYMKLMAEYVIQKGDIMTSEYPYDKYKQTVSTLENLLQEIKPEFFPSQRDYEIQLRSFQNQQKHLIRNGRLFSDSQIYKLM